jgi:hypothetical protein
MHRTTIADGPEIGWGGGEMVIGCSNVFQSQAPIENHRAMVQSRKDHGKYKIRKEAQWHS